VSESQVVTIVVALVTGLGLLALLAQFLVNVGANQVAILERRFIGRELAPGRVFGLAGEVGIQQHRR
jgi:hypothetical protein